MKKIQERADATVNNLREECAELAMDKMKLEATVQELHSRAIGEVTPREARHPGTPPGHRGGPAAAQVC